jgi:hypothetical protein
MKKLRRVQDLLSQKRRMAASLENSLEELLEFYLERNDPLEKAKRNLPKNLPGPGPGQNGTGRRPLTAQTKHQINLRDQGQCTHVDGDKRCENRRWLEMHHRVPVSQGGLNEPNNLTTLCWAHHRMQH